MGVHAASRIYFQRGVGAVEGGVHVALELGRSGEQLGSPSSE